MTDSSRHLPPPPEALAVFGDQLQRVVAYAELLSGPGVDRGLLGPREAGRLWDRHLLNCAGLTELVPTGALVLDLGAGSGLPGIVLAMQRPDVTVVLVEPLLRRATFLEEAVASLELRNAVVRRARAEELAGSYAVEVVTARAVAPLERLVGWALPLLRPGGVLLAQKGEQAEEELAAAAQAITRAGGRQGQITEVGSASSGTVARVVVVTRAETSRAGGSDHPRMVAQGKGRPAGPRGQSAQGAARVRR